MAALSWARASRDGMRPPGKTYLLIQVCVRAVCSIRSCGMVMAWRATEPPGARRRRRAAKYVAQYSAPTASIISTLTTAS